MMPQKHFDFRVFRRLQHFSCSCEKSALNISHDKCFMPSASAIVIHPIRAYLPPSRGYIPALQHATCFKRKYPLYVGGSCRRFCFGFRQMKNPTAKTAVGDKVIDSAVPPRIDTASLPHPLIDCQHSLASYASFTSSATGCLSPRPSGAHIIGFGSCRHHTAADSL